MFPPELHTQVTQALPTVALLLATACSSGSLKTSTSSCRGSEVGELVRKLMPGRDAREIP